MLEGPATQPSLLLRLRDPGDERAWAQFVDLYAPLVYRYGRGKGLQDADAADLTQAVLRAVAGAIGRFEYDPRRGSFRGWFFTILRNKALSFLSKRHDLCPASGDPATLRLLEAQPASDQETAAWETEYERRVFAWAVEQVRPSVSHANWQAFWQTAVEGRSGKDVAAALGIPLGAVYLAKSRVLARLKTVVQEARTTEFAELEDFPKREADEIGHESDPLS